MELKTFTQKNGRKVIHPPFNQLVFKNIASFLNVQDLKQIRLVCKTWENFVLSTLQTHSWVKFGLYDSYKFASFLEFLQQTPNHVLLYQHYEFCNSMFLLSVDAMNEFITRCGPSMKSLHFIHVTINVNIFRNIIFNSGLKALKELSFTSCYFCQEEDNINGIPLVREGEQNKIIDLLDLPQLKKFSYKNSDEENDAQKKILPFTWNEFFTYSPLLKELNLMDFSEEMLDSFLMEASKHKLNVKKLNIFGESNYSKRHINQTHWKLLHDSNLQLESLQIDVGFDLNESFFTKFLKQQRFSLVQLKIWRGILGDQLWNFPYQIYFPILEYLEIPENMVTSLDFINYTRSLERLWIRQCDNDPVEDFTNILNNIDHINPLESMKEFRIDSYLSENDLLNLKSIFPKVMKIDYFKEFVVTDEANNHEGFNEESDWED